ncbi:hypothetical protein Mgra_00000920 [Meloidogyne graminicola]|uniref:F-box domain-containing protein n=1 Tax=Meloidogyne graminicola TaxID=189291 RepID=A0A8T0A3R9_9BILA|nr:hypothetical protein Mgra_00000920 [Meloidogyne graminicola]
MNELSNQIKFDIFKCLNFKQLILLKNVNYYFNKFIENYKKDLAHEYFNQIKIVS